MHPTLRAMLLSPFTRLIPGQERCAELPEASAAVPSVDRATALRGRASVPGAAVSGPSSCRGPARRPAALGPRWAGSRFCLFPITRLYPAGTCAALAAVGAVGAEASSLPGRGRLPRAAPSRGFPCGSCSLVLAGKGGGTQKTRRQTVLVRGGGSGGRKVLPVKPTTGAAPALRPAGSGHEFAPFVHGAARKVRVRPAAQRGCRAPQLGSLTRQREAGGREGPGGRHTWLPAPTQMHSQKALPRLPPSTTWGALPGSRPHPPLWTGAEAGQRPQQAPGRRRHIQSPREAARRRPSPSAQQASP